MSVLKCFNDKRHLEIANSIFNAWKYCGKEETRVEGPWEVGIPPAAVNVKGQKKERTQMLLKKTPIENLLEGNISLLQYNNFKKNYNAAKRDMQELSNFVEFDNHWFYGETGTGKSKTARERYGDSLYSKCINKWFDGYEGQ